jgi:hypothetical protein
MKKIQEFLYRDNYLLGILLAILVPLLSIIIVFPVVNLMKSYGWIDVHFPISKYLLLCCIPNFIVFRQYLKGLKMEKTGKAMFIFTLVEVVVLLILSNRSIF